MLAGILGLVLFFWFFNWAARNIYRLIAMFALSFLLLAGCVAMLDTNTPDGKNGYAKLRDVYHEVTSSFEK